LRGPLQRAGDGRARANVDGLAAGAGLVAVVDLALLVDALVHLRLRRQRQHDQRGGRELHSWCCGFTRSILLSSLFSALIYAFAEATTMSVSAPTPFTTRPPFARRTVTSPCDSVPVVTALTENSSSSAPLFAIVSIALKVASTGPSPCDSARFSAPFDLSTTVACGRSPMPLAWLMVTRCQCSSVVRPASCATSACRSSSKISAFLSARSLKRWNALLAASSLSSSMPSSFRRCLKALRPESLPSTILLVDQPTSSA